MAGLDDISIFDQEKYKRSSISSFRLNEVFGYASKTILDGLYEVFEPRADARNLIVRTFKRAKARAAR